MFSFFSFSVSLMCLGSLFSVLAAMHGRFGDCTVTRSYICKINPNHHPSTTILDRWKEVCADMLDLLFNKWGTVFFQQNIPLGLSIQRILLQKSCFRYFWLANVSCATMICLVKKKRLPPGNTRLQAILVQTLMTLLPWTCSVRLVQSKMYLLRGFFSYFLSTAQSDLQFNLLGRLLKRTSYISIPWNCAYWNCK